MLTIIIPIKQSLVKLDCIIRLWVNLHFLKQHPSYGKHFKVKIADCSHFVVRPCVWAICCSFNANYQAVKYDKNHHYSPAYVKNEAIKNTFSTLENTHILLLDVDVLLSNHFIWHVLSQVKEKIDFDWYPVAFLNHKFNSNFMLKLIKNTNLLNIEKKDILQVGYVTGLHLLSNHFFNKTGGYDNRFQGYGCEDIEMIHRASLILNLRKSQPPNSIYYTDDRGYDASKLKGFRNFYYQLKHNQPLKCELPYHFWHKRHTKSKYLQSRITNDKLLITIMKNFDQNFTEQ